MTAPFLEYMGFVFILLIAAVIIFIVALAIAIVAATIGHGGLPTKEDFYD